jgi:hypothetical protein
LDAGEPTRQLRGQQLIREHGGRALPRRRQALDREAVVGGEDRDLRRAKAWLERVLDQPEAHGERLELAQATGGFGSAGQLLAQRLLEQRVRRGRDERTIDRHGVLRISAYERRLSLEVQRRNRR